MMQKDNDLNSRKKYFNLTDRIESPIDLYQHLPFQIAVVSNLLQLSRDPAIKQLVDLEPRELRVILNIGSYMPIKSADIAYQSRMDAYTVSRAVKRLQQHKLIDFEADDTDKKAKFLVLTDNGVNIYKQICSQIEKREAKIEANLSNEEKQTLMRLLAKLEDSAETMLAENVLLKQSVNETLTAEQKEIIRWWKKSQQ